MNKTLVIQSHANPIPAPWFVDCINSVKNWAEHNKFTYQFLNDELFDYVPTYLLNKTKHQPVIATDLARLKALQNFLRDGYQTVIWCDADFLIFAPDKFKLPAEKYAVGREVWIQQDSTQKITAHIKVHNAFMMFRQGNTFLDFYSETAQKLLDRNCGSMPPQFIGPKLLTAIHNIAQCPVLETAGVLSPMVIKDITSQQKISLELFRQRSLQPIAAANLCNSLYQRGEISTTQMQKCIAYLLTEQVV